MVLMPLDEFQNHPNNQNYVVNPKRNEYYKKTPLDPRLQPKAEKNQKCHCDEPSEECSLYESHRYLTWFGFIIYLKLIGNC